MPTDVIYIVVPAVICTLLTVAFLCLAFLAILRIIKFAKEMLAIVRAIAKMAPAVEKIGIELTMLRSIFSAGQQQMAEQQESGGQQAAAPVGRAPFPSTPPNFYPAVRVEEPDAAVEDTEVTETTDKEFLENEELEAVRGRGFEAE